jgi:hypothetical protein
MLVKTIKQYADILTEHPSKVMITGKSGTGKSLSLKILDHLGRKAGDLDWHGTQVSGRHSGNLADLAEWTALQNPDGRSMRVYTTYNGYGIVIKLWMTDGKLTIASFKAWDLATTKLEKVVSAWKTNEPVKMTEEIKSLIAASDLVKKTDFAQEFVTPLWIVDSGALEKYDYISGTCDNKDSVITSFKPKVLFYNRLEYSMQIKVWQLKSKSPYLPKIWAQWFDDMSKWSRSKAEREYEMRLDLMRIFGFNYHFEVVPLTLADFGIPLKNAWSGADEEAWIKKNLKS